MNFECAFRLFLVVFGGPSAGGGELGLKVVRFRNDEVLKNLPGVVGKVMELLN